MDTSLNGYAERFEKALTEGSSFANYNKDMAHASIIVCLGFRYAKRHVRLLSHQLDPVLYGSKWFQDELTDFLENRSGRVQILLETDVAEGHPVIALGAKYDTFEVRRIRDDLVSNYPFNFMTVDDVGYRFEQNREYPEATVVFNLNDDPDFEDLRKICVEWFDSNWEAHGVKAL